MALITQSELEARLKRSLSSEEVSAFNIINNGLQSIVEKIIGSSLESVSLTSRRYNGGVQHLRIDPCTSISVLKLLDDDGVLTYTYDTSDYIAHPYNKTLKTMLIHRPGRFVTGIANIEVTAKFSIYEDTETLNIVKDAMLDALVSEIQNNNNIVKESIEGYSVEYASTEAKAALSKITYLFPGV